ncbi:MAG: choice-of-anchor D domain-containing protein, partial [bacterium]
IATNDLSLGIGSQSNGTTMFQGAIDEARVYCRALGPNEIQALAQPPANDPPVAVCQNVIVPSGQTCPVAVDASEVDNGSYDPDGDPITLALDPPGPYPNGVTLVDLIVSDGSQADTCAATITIDCAEPPECIAGVWPMDEGSGTALVDVSGNGNDGTIYGAPSWITGVVGLALDLNGTSDYVRVPADPTLDITDAITLAAWIRPEKVGTQYLLKKAVINGTDGYELSLSTSGLAFVRFNQVASANGYRIDTTTPYPTDGNTWMHLAATYDGSTIRLYVNGTEESSASAAFAIATNDLDLAIGSQSNGTVLFQGAMDDARVCCRALSPTEIRALASCAVVPTSIDFGAVTTGNWRDETFNIINLGSELLSGDISESCDQFSVVSGSGPYSIAPGESLTVTVRFSPTVSGEDTCVVDTGNDLCDDVTLRGVGDATMEVSVVPDYVLTNCATPIGYTFHFEAGLNEVRGYYLTLSFVPAVV